MELKNSNVRRLSIEKRIVYDLTANSKDLMKQESYGRGSYGKSQN